MWPLSRRPCHILRVCRDHVELWQRERDTLLPVARHAATAATPGAWAEALAALPASLEADVVVESAWMPVVPLEAGTTLWSERHLDALFEHRLAHTYGSDGNAVATWPRRLDYRAGDAHGIGYALPTALSEALAQAASRHGRRWRSLQPAFRWGWCHHAARRRQATLRRAPACWVWLEHDRALVAMTVGERITALNPAADPPADDAALQRLASREAVRFGIEAADLPVAMGTWAA